MKNKTKIMLGLSLLTAGTLAAGATGTFAWFTTNKTATATYSNITVQGTTGNLKVSIKGVTDKTVTGAKGTDTTATGTTLSVASDVSSKDGLAFYQPDWQGQQGNEKGYNKIKDVSASTGYFTQYTVTIENEVAASTSSKLDVKLTGVEITVTKTDTSSGALAENAKNWVRVAVNTNVDSSDTSGFLKTSDGNETFVFQNSVTDDYKKYVIEKDDNTGAKLSDKIDNTWEDGVLNATGTNLSISPTKWVNLPNTTNNFVTAGVSVWIEGTSSDNQDNIKGATISVKLSFSAVDSSAD